MEHFRIYDEEHPAPLEQTSMFTYDEGNWVYSGTGNIRVFAFEDEGENVEIYVATKPRYELIEEKEVATKYKLSPLFNFAV